MKIEKQLQQALTASGKLSLVSEETVKKVLFDLADEAEKNIAFILQENQKDLKKMEPENPKYDRLKLTAERIQGIAKDMRNVANLDSPVGKVLKETVRPNGLKIKKVTVAFGVIGIIYEARPNVTFDVFSLCLKSGDCLFLEGGQHAILFHPAVCFNYSKLTKNNNLDENTVSLLPSGREE